MSQGWDELINELRILDGSCDEYLLVGLRQRFILQRVADGSRVEFGDKDMRSLYEAQPALRRALNDRLASAGKR